MKRPILIKPEPRKKANYIIMYIRSLRRSSKRSHLQENTRKRVPLDLFVYYRYPDFLKSLFRFLKCSRWRSIFVSFTGNKLIACKILGETLTIIFLVVDEVTPPSSGGCSRTWRRASPESSRLSARPSRETPESLRSR